MKTEVAKLLIEESKYKAEAFIKLLDEKQIKVTGQTEEGDTFLHVLFMCDTYKNHDVIPFLGFLLKNKLDVNHLNKKVESCFELFSRNLGFQAEKIALVLLEAGLDVNRQDSLGNTYLHNLCQSAGHLHDLVIKIISKKMSSILITNQEGDNFLHVLFKTNSYYINNIIEYIGNHSVNLNQSNKKGETCLDVMLAHAQYTSDDIVKSLIKLGLDVNLKDAMGNLCLHKIPEKVDYNLEKLAIFIFPLLNTPFVKNNSGKTIVDIWISRKIEESSFLSKLINNYISQLSSKELIEILKDPATDNRIKKQLLTCETIDPILLDSDNNTFLMLGLDCLLSIYKTNEIDGFWYASDFNTFFNYCNNKKIDQYLPNKSGEVVFAKILNCNLSPNKKNTILGEYIKVFKPNLKTKVTDKTLLDYIDFDNLLDSLLVALLNDSGILSDPYKVNELQKYCVKNKLYPRVYQLVKLTTHSSKEMEEKLKEIEDIWEKESVVHKESIYSDTKLLAHKFSLNGKIAYNLPDKKETLEIELTGSNNYSTLPNFFKSLIAYTVKTNVQQDPQIKQVFGKINETVRKSYRYYQLLNGTLDEQLEIDIFTRWLLDCKTGTAFICTGYLGHSISLVIVEGKTLYRCNRGGCSSLNDIVEQYEITKPDNLTIEVLKKIIREDGKETNKMFLQKEIHDIFGLKLVQTMQGKSQSVGNCSWASKKAGLRALIHAELVKIRHNTTQKEIHDHCRKIFKAWSSYDKNAFLDDYLKKYKGQDCLEYILARMLCIHSDPASAKDITLATKILSSFEGNNAKEKFLKVAQLEILLHHWKLGLDNKKDNQEQFVNFLKKLNIDMPKIEKNLPAQIQLFLASIANDNKLVAEILKSNQMDDLIYLGWNPLHIASAQNNGDLVTSLCQQYPKLVNMKNAFEETPIFFAANDGIAEKLISAGAKINMGEDYTTPLNAAIKRKNEKLVDFLMKNGAEPNDYSLFWAARYNSIPIAQKIILRDKTKYLTSKTYNYQTAIHAASSRGHTDFLKYLVSIGADVNAKDVNGNTPMHLAVKYHQEQAVLELFQTPGCKVKTSNNQNRNPFDAVNSKEKADTKQGAEGDIVVQKFLSPNLQQFQLFANQNKLTLMNSPEEHLYCAIGEGNRPLVENILTLFPKIKINENVNPFSMNPFHHAILKQNKELFDLFLSLPNIDVNAAAESDERPIHLAVAVHNEYILNTLLTRPEIQINEPGDFGYTALHEAVSRKNLPAIKSLLARPEIRLDLRCKRGKLAKELKPDFDNKGFLKKAIELIENREQELLNKPVHK